MMKKIAIMMTWMLTITALASGAEDNAADKSYSPKWKADSNGGSGFEPWIFGVAARPIHIKTGSAAENGGTSAIDSNGRSFVLCDADNSKAFIDVFRYLTQPLRPGETLSVDLDVNFRAGYKGVRMRNAGDDASSIRFEVGEESYRVFDVETGAGPFTGTYANDTIFRVEATQTTTKGGVWRVIRLGSMQEVRSGTFKGQIASLQFYTSEAGPQPEEALIFNNLEIHGASLSL